MYIKSMKKTTLQNFKANLKPGARCAFSANWCKLAIRTVITVQSKKVSFTHPTRSTESWLDIPKLSEIFETSPNVFSIIHTDDPDKENVLHYDFSAEGIARAEQTLKS